MGHSDQLAGRVALVTGASGGLGSEICRQLALADVTVIAGYRNGVDRTRDLCEQLRDQGATAHPIRIDHTDPDSISACISEITERFGALDILVNNAGMASGGHSIDNGDLDAFTPEIWEEMLTVNLSGPYFLTRAAAPMLRASRLGRVVNISSTIGHGPWGAAAAYAPSKAAVVPLTRFLAAALAPDVTVNCISPGLMEGTRMSGGAPDAFVKLWRDKAIMNTTTSLHDVARQVLTLCQSETMTGQTIVMDGGIHFD